MKRRLTSFIVPLSLFMLSQLAFADSSLLKEMESLRNGLAIQDPARPALTLRLADLYFDSAVELNQKRATQTLNSDGEATLVRYQKRALNLYKEALTGSDGLFKVPTGELKIKLEFQLARIESDLEKTAEAKKLFKGISDQALLPDLRRESALRLAEFLEKDSPSEADSYFKLALGLCGGTDVCSYAHYRRAWLMKNSGHLPESIAEMKSALRDSRGQVREEALRDWISFQGLQSGNATVTASLAQTDELSKSLARPDLVHDLADAYFASGNRQAGIQVLSFYNKTKPQLKDEVKLAEEYYGLRDWDNFRETLSVIAQSAPPAVPAQEAEIEKVIRRLTVQLDGQRISEPQYTEDFKNTVQAYLHLFPKSPETIRMMDGWIAAESGPNSHVNKLNQVQAWIKDFGPTLSPKDTYHLHEIAAAEGQKAGKPEVVASEMAILTAQTTDPAKQREYRYLQARALYEMKKNDEALPLFQALADPAKFSTPDSWAVQSQNLALDIYNQKKDYTALVAQAHLWTSNPKLSSDSKISKDIADISEVSKQAEFTQAVDAGTTVAGLESFKKMCLAGEMLPKSCDNAKVLSVKLKNQEALIAVLKKQNNRPELAAEYEAAGYFIEAARLLEEEEGPKAKSMGSGLKIALLYELGGKDTDRNRWLNLSTETAFKQKEFAAHPEEENLLLQSLKDAGLITASLLNEPWSDTSKARIANELEEKSAGNPKVEKVLLASSKGLGKGWSTVILREVKKLDEQQQKIHFYGKRSEMKFKMRIAALEKEVGFAKKYLDGADLSTRVALLGTLANSYSGLSTEILSTPVPPNVDAATAEGIKQSLNELAQPFKGQEAEFAKLAADQTAKEQAAAAPQVAKAPALGESLPGTGPKAVAMTLNDALESLHHDPSQTVALSEIRDHYKQVGQPRLASYFEGRLKQLQGSKQ